jgi:hypothetical protein
MRRYRKDWLDSVLPKNMEKHIDKRTKKIMLIGYIEIMNCMKKFKELLAKQNYILRMKRLQ